MPEVRSRLSSGDDVTVVPLRKLSSQIVCDVVVPVMASIC
jgi:hypothetical protein